MKKRDYLVGFALFCAIVGLVFADSQPPTSVGVKNSSITVLPNLKPILVTRYVTGYTNSQGTYFSVPANPGTYYWVVSPASGGTNAGVLLTNYTENVDITDGDLTIRSVPKSRTWYRIGNISTSQMFLAEGQDAVANAGIVVDAGDDYSSDRGSELGDKCFQGEVNMISSSSTTGTVAVFTK